MNILALDTSTVRAALVVGRDDGRIWSARPDPAVRHGRGLVPAVRDLMAQAGLSLDRLDAIGVGLGPGSYTGLRIGLTAAKSLAYALEKPLYGVDSLELVAANAPAEALRVAAVADAQRGDLAIAEFERAEAGGPLRRVGATRVERASAWVEALDPGTVVLGPGTTRLVALLPPERLHGGPDSDVHFPEPIALLELTRRAIAGQESLDLFFVEPTYLRRSAAEDKLGASQP